MNDNGGFSSDNDTSCSSCPQEENTRDSPSFSDIRSAHLPDIPMEDVFSLWARANYSKKMPHLLRDEHSWQLYNELHLNDFDALFSKTAEFLGLSIIIRTSLFDQEIKSFEHSFPGGSIIVVGAGLSTVHTRLANLDAHWYYVDLPPINTIRQQYCTGCSQSIDILDYTDIDWINHVPIMPGQDVLVVFPSSLQCADPIKVAILMESLADKWPSVHIVFDALTTKALGYTEIMNTMKSLTGKDYTSSGYTVDDIEEEVQMWSDEDLQFNVLRSYGIFDAVSIKSDWEKHTQKTVMRALILRAYNMHHVYHAATDIF
ncbi:MAG: hypothetical protein Q4P66_09550 [Actinomycetaceae bacterium]|nr:hypothetical protein [Actinomycetaceae bacterium]